MQLWEVLPLTRSRFFAVQPAPGCRLALHTTSMAIDVLTMDYVFRRELFPVELAGRVTVDIGAHKGYFGALAMVEGAAAVYSFEPESSNFEALRRATVAGRDLAMWARRNVAVGATDGDVALHVSTESWSHSVHEPASGTVLHTERVTVVAFAGVLAELTLKHPGASMLLKLNVEGAAGDCLLSVPASALKIFDELLVDLESNTPQRLDAIVGHIVDGGFHFVAERERVYHFIRIGTSA
jgi:FkbM family methyltransferase